MAITLKTKPGINGANVLSIPSIWDPNWFRHFINNLLKGADVRNAVGEGGITVSGNISSPYATINLTGPLDYDATVSTGASTPTLGSNKPGSPTSLSPVTWETVVINGTTFFRPLWQ
jgi:hypothetical protein